MNAGLALVRVVIHDSAPELRRLLDSVDRHLPVAPRIVVVDTGSRDDGAELARARGAELMSLPDNPGFGAANNAGLARVREPLAALVNPDVELLDDGLARLAARAQATPRLLAPGLRRDADGTRQHSAHPLPGTPGAFVPALLPPAALPRAIRERAEPWRSSARARSVGRSPRASWRAPRCCAGSGRSIRGSSCSSRISTCACARGPPVCRPSCTPRSCSARRGGARPSARTAGSSTPR